MFLFDALLLLLLVYYLCLMLYYRHYWLKTKQYVLPTSTKYNYAVSVIIAARNESNNIASCLESALYQSYPRDLYEVIVVDDHSEDATASIVAAFVNRFSNVHLLHLKDYIKDRKIITFKKEALAYGISKAAGRLIITTDADCVVGHNWLATLVTFYLEKNAKAVAGPVMYHQEKNVFERCQSLDMLGMMGVTGSSITSKLCFMGNGANLAFSKEIFYEIGAYTSSEEFASGDDMLLLDKIAVDYAEDIHFLKSVEATVKTKASKTISKFIQQRLRWATKNTSLRSIKIPLILGGIYLFNLILVLYFFKDLLLERSVSIFFLMIWIVKMCIDFVYLLTLSRYFNRTKLLRIFIQAQLFHVFYIVIIGTLAQFKKQYVWKQRTAR